MEEKELLKIAPDLYEIDVVGNVVECVFNGSYIRWVLCVDGRLFDDSDKQALKLLLQGAIGISSNKKDLLTILKKSFKTIHTEVYVNKAKFAEKVKRLKG